MSTIHFAPFSMSSYYAFLLITVFSAYLILCNRGYLMVIHPLSATEQSRFFSCERHLLQLRGIKFRGQLWSRFPSMSFALNKRVFIFSNSPWCSRYRRRKWTRRHEFKSWTRLIAFHIALISLGKVWIQLFSLQLWVNSRID